MEALGRKLPALWATSIICVARCLTTFAYADPVWISIQGRTEFADVNDQLQVLANSNGHRTENQFCVVGQQDGHYVQAYVYWPDENKLILWEPHLYDNQALVGSKRYLDLTRDVVAGDDVHGSTYLLTRADADAILLACHLHGEQFMIKRERAPGQSNG